MEPREFTPRRTEGKVYGVQQLPMCPEEDDLIVPEREQDSEMNLYQLFRGENDANEEIQGNW